MNSPIKADFSKSINVTKILIVLCFGLLSTLILGFNFASAKSNNNNIVSGKEIAGETIVESARSYVGHLRYSYGGTSLKYGCDCSGFICALYKKAGVNFNGCRSSWDMLSLGNKMGKKIGTDMSKAEAGDIVIYNDHVALATGEETVVNCQNSGCMEQSVGYMRTFFGRVIGIVRLDNVKNLKVGDIVKHKKSGSFYKVLKNGNKHVVKYVKDCKQSSTKKASSEGFTSEEIANASTEAAVEAVSETSTTTDGSLVSTSESATTEVAATEETAVETATETTTETSVSTKADKKSVKKLPKKIVLYGIEYKVVK